MRARARERLDEIEREGGIDWAEVRRLTGDRMSAAVAALLADLRATVVWWSEGLRAQKYDEEVIRRLIISYRVAFEESLLDRLRGDQGVASQGLCDAPAAPRVGPQAADLGSQVP